jgi:hypothetical protein
MGAPLIGIPKPIAYRFTWPPKIRKWHKLIDISYNQLDKAIENAEKNLGFKDGAAPLCGYYEW